MLAEIVKDLDALPEDYKTKNVDALIRRYVKEKTDFSDLRDHILTDQRLHRIYFHGSLKRIKDPATRMAFIDQNLLFNDWWHTDQLIDFVKAVPFDVAYSYAERYVADADPFIRRWGYVMFISKLCRDEGNLDYILTLFHNDDHYYVQMAEAWLIAELAVFFPDRVYVWLPGTGLEYNISGKAIQKICDSYRITDEMKEKFKGLRGQMKG